MAILSDQNLILPKGKLGNLVFYTLNGKTVVRSKPSGNHKNKFNPSPLQLIQREKLTTINGFLKPIKQVLNFGYQQFLTQSKKGMHWAFSELSAKGYNHTLETKVDPSFLKISKGNLLGPEDSQLRLEGGTIQITWKDNSFEGNARANDEVSVLCYNVEEKRYKWFQGLTRRNAIQAQVPFDIELGRGSWHIYLIFAQENAKTRQYLLADSVYLGRI
ncbi:MAG: DUF6266 family protein [Algoriphagus sp.]|uniref:DUF6266 family protein n=1 Tax=Algoriphagus sp. TaxID=1872435 RepID=UPI002611C32A|nr:DUF6266 family protein [Algoriphagus sp.]MDG1278842.1 DUF6266 family protein [Algoriphagus sp.]